MQQGNLPSLFLDLTVYLILHEEEEEHQTLKTCRDTGIFASRI